ncbi:hypothetical protein FB45DRAFT_152413 [Roridomyces roridus]|uniref:F-box domain-containing protein n=1 Tax=Roridomyces roridus TaxID=1738132 RepID=A0AAD7AXQ6_9AGAR|nr:hypothetical protein FB45DRAFT_152413 [Roridomyces roridus]
MCFHHDDLPTELWLEIFSHLDIRSYFVSHEPFQPIPGVSSEAGNTSGSSYHAVVLVCRNWRAWAIQLQFRNIKLSEELSQLMHEATRIHGEWVRRAVVPYSTTVTATSKPMLSTGILGNCHKLEVLVRPPYQATPLRHLKFEFDATCPPLPSLKRLDFWNHIEASRSGGINSLTAVLAAAPNLEYLFIGGGVSGTFFGLVKSSIHLPRLRTLRLNIANALLLRDVLYRWTLPELDNLVVDSPVPGMPGMEMSMVWETLGPQLRIVEFGRHLRFLLHQTLSPCLRGCPNLVCVNFYVFITMPPEMDQEEVFPSVTSIGIHLLDNPFLGGDTASWEQLERHFDAFTGPMFPGLQRVRVFGPRQSILGDARFAVLSHRLNERGCALEFPDGRPFLN